MRYFVLFFVCLICTISCNNNKPEKEVIIKEVPIPSEPPRNDAPPLGPEKPGFIAFDQAEQFALNDINSLSDAQKLNTRYLMGCNFFNAGKEDLSQELAGVNKGINMVSVERLLAYATPIDPASCLWRIDIEEIGVDRQLWFDFEDENLIDFISISTRGITLRALAQTNQPMVWASSFFTTVMGADQLSINNGLYYKFTQQADNNEDFFADIGFDLQGDTDDERICCVGGGRSQIALGKTRMLCVAGGGGGGSNDGFVLATYDTSLDNPDSVLVNPFTVEMANAQGIERTDKIFDHAAQEFIFSMPNGLLTGYRLSNAAGDAETIAPTNVVIDVDQSQIGLAPDITLGACSNCHHQEAGIDFNDQVFNQVVGTGGFNADEKILAEVFFNQDAFKAKLATANQIHTQQLAELGVSTLEEDPVVTKLIQPLRRELDADAVASYTFLPTDEFLQRLSGTDFSKITFGSLLNNGTVQLADLESGYDDLIAELGLFRDNSL